MLLWSEGGKAPPTLVKAWMAWARTASSTSTGTGCRLTRQCNTQRTVWCWPCFLQKSKSNKFFLKNASGNKLKASATPGTGLWPSAYNLQRYLLPRALPVFTVTCLNAFRSCLVITWSTISNEMFSLKWTEGVIHSHCFWTQWCQLGCVCWHVTATRDLLALLPADTGGQRGVRRDQAALGKPGSLGEGLWQSVQTWFLGLPSEKQRRSPTPAQWASRAHGPQSHWLHLDICSSTHDHNSDADRSKPLTWCQRPPVGMEWVTMEAHAVPEPWAWILLRHRLRAWAVMSPSLFSKTDPLPFWARGMNKGEHRIYSSARAWPATTQEG